MLRPGDPSVRQLANGAPTIVGHASLDRFTLIPKKDAASIVGGGCWECDTDEELPQPSENRAPQTTNATKITPQVFCTAKLSLGITRFLATGGSQVRL